METISAPAGRRLEPSGAFQPGCFFVGCNYWASHAGTAMWSDWQPQIVEQDFRKLSEGGLEVLRVFPLWPDFQPIRALYTQEGRFAEIRFGEVPLPNTAAGRAGVSAEMMEHFQVFADLAEKYHLKLIVGLITGWMSGRLFVPPALEGKNILTDPTAIKWETRFVQYFIRQFMTHPAVLAWDLGNEVNCNAPLPSQDAAWAWTSTIANAIRAIDPSRPVVSGMHSLEPGKSAVWKIQDQGELMDVLTTHPYPYFTPHCDQDPVNTLRNLLHATSESCYYSDIGAKPCLVEEVGTLGPMIASNAVSADYARTILFSLWAHDCHGLLWWCAFDQILLQHPPYDWTAFERELGLIRADGTPKPVLKEIGTFGAWVRGLPFEALPRRTCQAVCILTEDQDSWGAAYSSFILAKQAGFDIRFQFAGQPLLDADLYLMPSVQGGYAFSRRLWYELLERVNGGATLYISHDTCLLSPFNEPFGLEVQTRQKRTAPAEFQIGGCGTTFRVNAAVKLNLRSTGAEVLANEPGGNPVFTCQPYGTGQLYFLSLPVERALSETPGAFSGPEALPFWQIYARVAQDQIKQRVAARDIPEVGMTEHVLEDGRLLVVAINYSPAPLSPLFTFKPGWRPVERLYGPTFASSGQAWKLTLPANDAAVFILAKEENPDNSSEK
jgi:hypothetical protein